MENRETLETVWQLLRSAFGQAQQGAASNLCDWLSRHGKNAAANALTLDPTHAWTAKDMRDLAQAVVDDFRPAKNAEVMLCCLDALVQCWHRVTKIVAPPLHKVFRIRRAHNPWRLDVVQGLRFQAQAKADLEQAIRRSSDKGDFDVLALGIASGIIHLGLLHPDCIVAVLHSIADPHLNLGWMGETLVIRQTLAVRGVPDSEHRIYLPDPLTATLLEQVTPDYARSILEVAGHDDKDAHKAILRALSVRIDAALAHCQKVKKRCYSIDNLVRQCTAAALYWRSPVIVAYLRRGLISHSPSLATLARIEPTCVLLALRAERAESGRAEKSGGHELRSIDADLAEVESEPEPNRQRPKRNEMLWFDSIREATAGKDKRKARWRLAKLLKDETLPIPARCLAEFALWQLNGSGSKGRNLRTLRDGLSLLARFLFPLLEDDDDPAAIARTGIEDLYIEAIDIHQESPSGESLSSQLKFQKWLVRFHDFLVVAHDAKPLEELKCMTVGCLPVDANLLTEDEVLAVKEAVRISPLIPAEQRIVALLLIIVATKCGLRHNEAFWLRPCDFDLGRVCMLIVQPYSLRGLKTRNALRRLNLTALFNPDELKLILEFVPMHQSQPLSPMFVPQPGQGLLDEDELFAAIHRIMRDTLGDQGLRFHHGRHSFGSFLALQLLSESPESYRHFFPSRLATLALLKECGSLRHALCGSDEVQISALDGLANMIGHATSKFSAAHYIHTLCFLAAAELVPYSEFACDLPTLIAASRLPSATAYRYASQGIDGIPKHVFMGRFRDQIQTISHQRAQQSKVTSSVAKLTPFQQGMDIMGSLAESDSVDEICEAIEDPKIRDLVNATLSKLICGIQEELTND